MKKTILLLCLALLLTSCFKSDEELLGISSENTTQEKEKIENVEPTTKEKATTTKKEGTEEEREEDSDRKIDKKNKNEVNVQEEKKNSKELIKEADGNIYLYENGKKIDYLTDRAFKKEKYDNCYDGIIYTIINSEGDYGVIKKQKENCGKIGGLTFYAINLNNDEHNFTEIFSTVSADAKYSNKTLSLTWSLPDGTQGKKVIELTKKLPNKSNSQSVKKNNNTVASGTYNYNILVGNGYKFNQLGDITEYFRYKTLPEETVMENGIKVTILQGGSEANTIYVKGNKVLDFSIINQGGNFLVVKNPKEDMSIDLAPYGYDFIQPIFDSYSDKKVIIQDMDTIKVINKEKGINKVIWKRGKGFIK